MKTNKVGTGLAFFSRFSAAPLIAIFFFLVSAGFSHAVDIESVQSHELLDRLLSMKGPGAPEIFEDMVIFTAPSDLRRVGIAFADEGFSKVHWFRQFMVSKDPLDIRPKDKKSSMYEDFGFSFHVHKIPEGAVEIEYRLIINGLWTTDPLNPNTRRDQVSGLSLSTISVPPLKTTPHPLNGPSGSLSFVFNGPSGETVTVAGSFNGWDPFMYELKEGPKGNYSINIPLPPGRYQYVFFHRGQRYLDPYNASRVYSREGAVASEIVIE